MKLPGDQIPKGMEIPAIQNEEPGFPLSLAEVNFTGKIRASLSEIPDLDVRVLECITLEMDSTEPQVHLKLQICRKEAIR